MAELTEALLNKRRGRNDKANILEELCHVLISCEVLRKDLNIKYEELIQEANKKYLEIIEKEQSDN